MTWMFDADIMIRLINRKSGYERIARRMSGRSPGELRLGQLATGEGHLPRLTLARAQGPEHRNQVTADEDLIVGCALKVILRLQSADHDNWTMDTRSSSKRRCVQS